MRDSGMSSSASTSATIVKRTTNDQNTSHTLPTPTSKVASGSKCRCCPYGFHIDLGFVSYAQDVSNGFISRQGTPVHFGSNGNGNGISNGNGNHHKSLKNLNGDRNLMSPLDSIFSDSLENIMSDFEEALAPHRGNTPSQQINSIQNRSQDIRKTIQNGYNSDYTAYRRESAQSSQKIRPTFDAKPSRPNFLNYPGSRSNTPIGLNNNNNSVGYATALAKTVSEIRARNAESPFPGPDSRVATPIDLGLQNGTHSNGTYQTNGFNQQYTPNYRSTTPSRIPFKNNRDEELPPTPTPTFRRAPSQGDINPSSSSSEFTSLRRGREYSLPDSEPRVRFFSASPKLPRRLQLAPVEIESHFTYSQQSNGETVLAKSQATSTSPTSAFTPVKPVVTRSVAVTTGPLPAPKPCSECPTLKKELENLKKPGTSVETSTEKIIMEDKSVGDTINFQHVEVSTDPPNQLIDFGTDPELKDLIEVEVQTNTIEYVDTASSPIIFETPSNSEYCQTEKNQLVNFGIMTDPSTSEEIAIPKSEECEECLKRKDIFSRNVGVGSCTVSDKICLKCDENETLEEIDENEAPGFKVDLEVEINRQREFEIAKANAVKKLLTNEHKSNFQRNSTVSKSARYERKKSVDDLDYIIDKNMNTSTNNPILPTTTPENTEALKTKVVLKKELAPAPPSKVPEPIPARIPRPKISKWATTEECAETPDEEEEAQDRLTPLRSELRSLGNRWPRNNPTTYTETTTHEDISDSDAESDCSDATFDITDDVFDSGPFEISEKLREALENYNSNLLEPGSVPEDTVEWSEKLVQHEWMKTAARKLSRYEHVDKFVEELKNLGPKIVNSVVNIGDQNGNSALHYAVSHTNFAVVSSILDCGEADLNCANRAGYTAVMLAALSSLEDEMERAVVQRLFEMGDVNAKATQHGQTALMLAVSHGKRATTELLLECGADVNVQDEEGSTALMCAAEHGHRELVKLLLSQPNIDASLTDCDSSTALSIAVENGHRDIGVLIYAHLNYSKLDSSAPTSTI